ncbi:MAG: ABC transporter permease subunit [Eubacteriales bacterium]
MKQPRKRVTLSAWLFWLIVWQIASMIIDMQIFLPSPISVASNLVQLLAQVAFWQSVAFTLIRIVFGFLLGTITALCMAAIASRFVLVETLLAPMMITVKSVPVASFIILVLIWFSSKNLSVLISFLMAMPIIYTSILQGIHSMDKALLEMAQIFRFHPIQRIRYLYGIQVFPYFKSSVMVAIGLCFKAGIAAEVIGVPSNSIGAHIFESKIYLDTVSLFAWTVVVLLLSVLCEKILLLALRVIQQYFCKCVGGKER